MMCALIEKQLVIQEYVKVIGFEEIIHQSAQCDIFSWGG